jgi:hypothetical protein
MRLSPHDPLTFNMQTATAAPTFFVGNNAAAESHGTLASTHAELNISGLKDLFPDPARGRLTPVGQRAQEKPLG